jgi:precorrin-2 dehydrogenase / sirohydrochlorin ferrochelatase
VTHAPGSPRPLYPMFVDIGGRRCLVVGGGTIATDKARKLVEHGAVLRVVSPDVTAELAAMTAADGAEHRGRTYLPEDLDGCTLAFAATDRADVNRAVAADARERGIPCNVADAPARGDFTVPSVVRRGDLAIAVSTGGASPVVARHVRRRIEEAYGPEWEALIALLRDLRGDLKARHRDMPGRRAAVERLMESDVLRRLAEGDDDGARALARRVLDLEGVAA